MGLANVQKLLAASAPPLWPSKRSALVDRSGLLMPGPATILKHCRCIDCRLWRAEPYSECKHGIIRNGLGKPQYPPDAWHYCARYHGPQISREVWVWPKVPQRMKRNGKMVPSPCK